MKIFRLLFFAVSLVLVALFSGCSKSSSPDDPDPVMNRVTNIFYLPGDTFHKHTLDVYYKLNPTPNDVVFFVPGGAWRQGDKSKYDTMAMTLATYYDFTVVVTNYRLSNPDDGAAVHPDHINDVAAAFSWTTLNIRDYGGNPGSIFLFGQSAGAHLVSLLATDTQYLYQHGCSLNDVRGVISMSAAYQLEDFVVFPLNPLGLNAEEVLIYKGIMTGAFGSYDTTVLNPASPARHLNGTFPPFLLITTDLDMPGFVADGREFGSALDLIDPARVAFFHLLQSDYSAETWISASEMAAQEPLLAEYIGHYAEVVAINPQDRNRVPTPWIVEFIRNH
ncbi:MAG: alpha/beta hydrolase [Bacteroidales bacterium]|nr:alpha/beta hydrolase [Bacteroidales bacterium]